MNREYQLIRAGHNLLKLFRFGVGMSVNARGNDLAGEAKESPPIAGITIFEKLRCACIRYRQQ